MEAIYKKLRKILMQLQQRKIVFPQAKKSMQSIQNNLTKNKNVESLIVYHNQPKSTIDKRSEAVLIFTSPMSVEAYFTKYTLD
jgi:uroporphyrinogen-III synthase